MQSQHRQKKCELLAPNYSDTMTRFSPSITYTYIHLYLSLSLSLSLLWLHIFTTSRGSESGFSWYLSLCSQSQDGNRLFTLSVVMYVGDGGVEVVEEVEVWGGYWYEESESDKMTVSGRKSSPTFPGDQLWIRPDTCVEIRNCHIVIVIHLFWKKSELEYTNDKYSTVPAWETVQ